MKKIILPLVILSVMMAMGCDNRSDSTVAATERGKLLSSEKLLTLSAAELALVFNLSGINSIVPTYGFTVYKIVYDTIDPWGNAVDASGAISIPLGLTTAPVVSLQHGTISKNSEAPSAGGVTTLIGASLATFGYIIAMPDYLGFGASSAILHPYLHEETMASASLDMLRAGMEFLESVDMEPNGQLFLAGYSQGGSATLALQKEIEQNHADEFTITASSAGAGAYDLYQTALDYLNSDSLPVAGYPAFLIVAFDDVYEWNRDMTDIFREPYASDIPTLFDGSLAIGEISSQLTETTADLFQQSFIDSVNGNGEQDFVNAIRENGLYDDWTPVSPTRLYHGVNDVTVPYSNSETAYDSFTNGGASDVTLVPCEEGAANHGDCALPFALSTIEWFNSFK